MKHHVRSWLRIDWQEENVSNAAHVVGPLRRTIGNALVGPPGADEDVEIPDDSYREPYPSRLFLAPACAVMATTDRIKGRPRLGGTTFVGMSCQERKGRNPTCYIHHEYERLAL